MTTLLDSAGGGGYGLALLQAVLALAAVSALAWVVLRWAAKRGLGAPRDGAIELLERRPLDTRSSVSLLRVGERRFLVGHGDGGAPRTLGQWSEAAPPTGDGARTEVEHD